MNQIEQYREFADTTKYLYIIGEDYNEIKQDFIEFLSGNSITIICDGNTKQAGANFYTFCDCNNIPIHSEYLFDAYPKPDASYKNVEKLVIFMRDSDSIPVVIGSGTLNDLVKRSAYELNTPYAVLATAASVDGYASDGAALLYKNLKQTLPCPAPAFIFTDSTILKDAPKDMTAAGYADLLAKNPAGADWIIADMLGIDKINRPVWSLIQENLLSWTDHPIKTENIMKGLTVAGFAMQFMKNSRPVSGTEHLLSHIWEMEHLEYRGETVSHGFKVGIGTLASVALMETLFSINQDEIDIEQGVSNYLDWEDRVQLIELSFPQMDSITKILDINRNKHLEQEQHTERLKIIKKMWPNLQQAVKQHILPYKETKRRLELAGCPTKPDEIGLTKDRVIKTYLKAGMLRERYTILDLAYETGLLEECLTRISCSVNYLK